MSQFSFDFDPPKPAPVAASAPAAVPPAARKLDFTVSSRDHEELYSLSLSLPHGSLIGRTHFVEHALTSDHNNKVKKV